MLEMWRGTWSCGHDARGLGLGAVDGIEVTWDLEGGEDVEVGRVDGLVETIELSGMLRNNHWFEGIATTARQQNWPIYFEALLQLPPK